MDNHVLTKKNLVGLAPKPLPQLFQSIVLGLNVYLIICRDCNWAQK